jgi:hypothetical protein
MARRPTPPAEPQPAILSPTEIKAAIPKLERRLNELEAVKIDRWDDDLRGELDALQMKVEETLTDVFGVGTLEMNRYAVYEFCF